MKHGEEINRTIKKTYSTFSGKTPDGSKVELNYSDSELTVADKFCSRCNDFVSTEPLGLLGFICCPQCKTEW